MGLQEALDLRLSPVLAGLTRSIPLHDQAPQGEPMPFAEFARITYRTDAELTMSQQAALVTIAIYSDQRGRREVVNAMSAIRANLHTQRFNVTGGEAVLALHEMSDSALDGDGVTWVGTTIYSIFLAPAE